MDNTCFPALLSIDGLEFQSNVHETLPEIPGWFTEKLTSSPGPMISDFVTHEAGFAYSTYGIHVGQVDRLTFLAPRRQVITAHFVDCRRGSPTFHAKVTCSFAASASRRLVIPRGVAHTFDNLEGVVTRDEPVWYASADNPDWNVNNDLISVLRSSQTFPEVQINPHLMNDRTHVFMSRLSQAVLHEPIAYSSRFLLRINGEDKYVMFQEKSWTDEVGEVQKLSQPIKAPGVSTPRSKYAITGARSWTLVPSTGSCVADVLLLPATQGSKSLFLHHRTRKIYTFLTPEGVTLFLDVMDLRPNSPTFGKRRRMPLTCDPRYTVAIDPGIAYAFNAPQDIWVRCEHEVFVSSHEPRGDLHPFGQDLSVFSEDALPGSIPSLPEIRCPDEIVRLIARQESLVGT